MSTSSISDTDAAGVQTLAFRMQLKTGAVPDVVAEYRRRHDELWPELADALRAAGIFDYWIFLDETSLALFAVLKCRGGPAFDELPSLPVMRRWWEHMAPLMETEPDFKPRQWPLPPLFHLA
jgi:L-rhamnose mutarotase